MGRNIQQINKIRYSYTQKYTIALRQTQVIRGQGATIPAPTLQFTLNTTVDLGGANLVPHYTRELQVHSGLPILVKLPIPTIHFKTRINTMGSTRQFT